MVLWGHTSGLWRWLEFSSNKPHGAVASWHAWKLGQRPHPWWHHWDEPWGPVGPCCHEDRAEHHFCVVREPNSSFGCPCPAAPSAAVSSAQVKGLLSPLRGCSAPQPLAQPLEGLLTHSGCSAWGDPPGCCPSGWAQAIYLGSWWRGGSCGLSLAQSCRSLIQILA